MVQMDGITDSYDMQTGRVSWIWRMDDVTDSYDMQTGGISWVWCMDDITIYYDMQTGSISWVWRMDDITASYDMQTDGISLVWCNWYAWQLRTCMDVRDVHASDDCRDGSTGVRAIESTKKHSTKLRRSRATRRGMNRRSMARSGSIGAQQEQLAHAVFSAHGASVFTAPADKMVKIWSPSDTLTASCVLSLLGGAP